MCPLVNLTWKGVTFVWEEPQQLVMQCLIQFHHGTTFFNGLVIFSSLSSNLIIPDFEPWGDSLWELTYLRSFTFSQTCVCLMTNLMSSNLTLFLTVHFHAVHGYATKHMHITCSMLLFHSATIIWLCHVLILICLSQTVLIDSVQTCIYNTIW